MIRPFACLMPVFLLAAVVQAGEPLPLRADAARAEYREALAVAEKRGDDVAWLGYFTEEIDKAAPRRRLRLAQAGLRLLGPPEKDLPSPLRKTDVEKAIEVRRAEFQDVRKGLAVLKIRMRTEDDLLALADRLEDTSEKFAALRVVVEAVRLLREKVNLLGEIPAKKQKLDAALEKAKAAGTDLTEAYAILKGLEAHPGDLFEAVDAVDKVLAMLGEGEEESHGGPDEVPDDDNVWESERWRFRIEKPPLRSWEFERVGEEVWQLHLLIKTEDMGGFVEVRALKRIDGDTEELAEELQRETRQKTEHYKLTSKKKISFQRKSAYEYTFTCDVPVAGIPVGYSCRRIYVKRSDVGYMITAARRTGQPESLDKPLNDILASFRFK